MRRHRICAIAAAATVAVVLGGCSIGQVDLDDYVARLPSVEEARAQRNEGMTPVVSGSALREEGKLVVGIPVAQTVPFSTVSDEGERVGLSVNMAHALADELGIPSVSFVTVSDAESALADACDVVIGVEPDDVTDATVLGPFAQSATGVFTRGEVSAPIDASALRGASLGIQEGSVSAAALSNYELNASRVGFTSLNEAFDAFESGAVDYVVCDAYSGAYLAAAYADISLAGTLGDPTVVGVAVANPELVDAVQAALETIQTSGLGAVARASWVGDFPELTTDLCVTGLVERVEEPESDSDAEDADDAEEGGDAEADGEASQTDADESASDGSDSGTGDEGSTSGDVA